jgi:hypothetical protein
VWTEDKKERELDTIPKKKSTGQVIVKSKDNDKEIEIKIKDGEVQLLKIDGKEIPPLEYEKHNDIIIKHMPQEDGIIKFFNFDRGLGDAFSFKMNDFDSKFPKNFNIFNFDSIRQMKFDSLFRHMDLSNRGFNFDQFDEFNFPEVNSFHFNFGKKSCKPDENGEVKLNQRLENEDFKIYSNGKLLKEGEDYTYDKAAGKIKITNEDYLKNNSPILVIPEGENNFGGQFYFNFPQDMDDVFDGQHFDFGQFDFPQLHDLQNLQDEENLLGLDMMHDLKDDNLETLIGKQLNRDGFLIAGKKNKIELSGKYLKINGEKQPYNIWNKYKYLAERELGLPLNKDSKLSFEIEGVETKRKYKSF